MYGYLARKTRLQVESITLLGDPSQSSIVRTASVNLIRFTPKRFLQHIRFSAQTNSMTVD
jgi:hypothetical protein